MGSPILETKFGIEDRQATSANGLQEFLNQLVLRSQCWCLVSSGNDCGFRVATNDAILFYAMLSGTATLSTTLGDSITLGKGDMAAVIHQRSHVLKFGETATVEDMPFLNSAQYLDSPTKISLGSEGKANRVLCGRLKVRWPGDMRATNLPATVKIPAASSIFDIGILIDIAQGKGGTSVLTHAAATSLTLALSQHPECQELFRSHSLRNPIEHSLRLMEDSPANNWTVNSLAQKVGVGRSAFAARFLAQVGKTPIEVLIELRMELARDLLRNSNLTISEVAEKVGYRSESAFHKRFTSYFKITPARIRH